MINISDELKQDYLQDSVPKQLYIKTDVDDPTKLDGINWYTGIYQQDEYDEGPEYVTNVDKDASGVHILPGLITTQDILQDYINLSKYVYISFFASLSDVVTLPDKIDLGVGGEVTSGLQLNNYPNDDISASTIYRFYCCIRNPQVVQHLDYLYFYITGACKCKITCWGVQIQSDDNYYETLSPFDYYDGPIPYMGESILLNPEGFDADSMIHIHRPDINIITNNDLGSESFTLTESLSSNDILKFGACESSHVEFNIIGRTEDWKDRYIRPYITTKDESFVVSQINWFKGGRNKTPEEIQSYSYNNSDLSWNMGTDEHALAPNLSYTKFQSFGKKMLGVKMKIKFTLSNYTVFPYKIRLYLSVFYDGNKTADWAAWGEVNSFLVSDITDDFVDYYFWLAFEEVPGALLLPDIYEISKLEYRFYDENNNRYSSGYRFNYTVEIKEIQFNLCDQPFWYDFPEWDVNDCLEYKGINIDDYIIEQTGSIPLGRYNVTDIQEDYTHEFRRLSITAYDDLIKLDQNAADWYTRYMYLICSNGDAAMTNRALYAYVRQIFSSFWSMAVWAGLISRDRYEETLIGDYSWDSPTTDWDFQVFDQQSGTLGSGYHLVYGYKDISVSSYTNKVFCVDMDCSEEIETRPNYYRYTQCQDYKEHIDSNYRGLINAQVCVRAYKNGTEIERFCADAGDYFILPSDCTSMRIYLPKGFLANGAQQTDSNIVDMINPDVGIKVYNINWEFDLENASARLTYFNWGTLNIFACDSSITARDVVRSLLELTGCFLAIDRFGDIQFRYCTKAALYPRDDLYPSNNLYPKGNDAAMLYMNQYTYARCKPYKVQSISRIQIVKQIRDNKARSVVEWEYIGDPTGKNAYLIDDNIFYCNDAMEYDWDNMPDIVNILEKLYTRISNISYTPNETQCIGLPWVETGDMVGVMTTHGGFESFIFRRTFKGIMALKDTYQAEGEAYTKPINNYAYKAYLR